MFRGSDCPCVRNFAAVSLLSERGEAELDLFDVIDDQSPGSDSDSDTVLRGGFE